MHPLILVGLIIELSGLGVALFAFQKTFRGNSPPGERLWSPISRTVRQAGFSARKRGGDLWRRIARRPRDQFVFPPTAELQASAGAGARIRTSLPRLRRIWDHEGALNQLKGQANKLHENIEDEAFERDRADNEILSSLGRLEERFEDDLGRDRAQRQADAVSDSRWQFFGLFLILLGLVVQTFGQLLQFGLLDVAAVANGHGPMVKS